MIQLARILVLLAIVVGFAALPVFSQTEPTSVVDTNREVRDILLGTPVRSSTELEFELYLRYLPEFEPESQVVISKSKRDRTYTVAYSAPLGKEAIWKQVQRLAKELDYAPKPIAKRIEIKHTEVKVPANVMSRLMNDYAKLRISPSLKPGVMAGGWTYELTFDTGSQKISIMLKKTIDVQSRTTIVGWMEDVRNIVLRYSQH